jgi:hypothetical protein
MRAIVGLLALAGCSLDGFQCLDVDLFPLGGRVNIHRAASGATDITACLERGLIASGACQPGGSFAISVDGRPPVTLISSGSRSLGDQPPGAALSVRWIGPLDECGEPSTTWLRELALPEPPALTSPDAVTASPGDTVAITWQPWTGEDSATLSWTATCPGRSAHGSDVPLSAGSGRLDVPTSLLTGRVEPGERCTLVVDIARDHPFPDPRGMRLAAHSHASVVVTVEAPP